MTSPNSEECHQPILPTSEHPSAQHDPSHSEERQQPISPALTNSSAQHDPSHRGERRLSEVDTVAGTSQKSNKAADVLAPLKRELDRICEAASQSFMGRTQLFGCIVEGQSGLNTIATAERQIQLEEIAVDSFQKFIDDTREVWKRAVASIRGGTYDAAVWSEFVDEQEIIMDAAYDRLEQDLISQYEATVRLL